MNPKRKRVTKEDMEILILALNMVDDITKEEDNEQGADDE